MLALHLLLLGVVRFLQLNQTIMFSCEFIIQLCTLLHQLREFVFTLSHLLTQLLDFITVVSPHLLQITLHLIDLLGCALLLNLSYLGNLLLLYYFLLELYLQLEQILIIFILVLTLCFLLQILLLHQLHGLLDAPTTILQFHPILLFRLVHHLNQLTLILLKEGFWIVASSHLLDELKLLLDIFVTLPPINLGTRIPLCHVSVDSFHIWCQRSI